MPFKFIPPHMWIFITYTEFVLDYFVSLNNIDGMDSD